MIDKDRRVAVWWREQRGAFEGPQTLEPMFLIGPEKPGSNYHGATYEPLYDQAELDAAVAAERERCAMLCDSETLIQHGEFGAGWVEGAKACAALIRPRPTGHRSGSGRPA